MVERMDMQSKDLTQEKIRLIGELFPNCITESRERERDQTVYAVDFDALRQELSDCIVEGPQERYQFTWPDKSKAKLLANTPTTMTLRPCREESVDFDNTQNLYIEGDNLEVLKILRETYLGKIKMIYIDPPYNTGNDFVYDDDFSVSKKDYDEIGGDLDEDGNRLVLNNTSNGRFHTDWLNMMYSRLILSKDLLKNDGLIFISIDENEIVNLRKICDEIFGSKSFIAQITLLCNPKGRSQDKYVANCHEYVLIYSKNVLPAGAVSIPKTTSEISKDYPLSDKFGPYRELELRNTHREFGKFNRPNLWYPIYVNFDGTISLENKGDFKAEVYPVWEDGFEGCWTWGKDKCESDISFLVSKEVAGRHKIYRKSYAFQNDECPYKQVKSIWTDSLFFTEKGQASFNSLFETKEKFFQSPKSPHLLLQCILMSQDQNGYYLDYFSGSGTFSHAIMLANSEDGGKRKSILVQIPEKISSMSDASKAGYKTICEIGKERIRRAGNQIKQRIDAQDVDVGFRVFKLDSSNMNDVFYSPEDTKRTSLDEYASNIKSDRTGEDLLFQVMLDLGIELSAKVEAETIDGSTIHVVDDGYLVACFDDSISEDVVITISKRDYKPNYVVFRNDSMQTDSMISNIEQIFNTYSPQTKIRIL